MIRAIILSALSFAGLALLLFFVFRLIRDIAAAKPLHSYAMKIGLPAAAVFLTLLLERLLPLTMGFLVAAVVVATALISYAALCKKAAREDPRGPVVTFRLVELGKYAKHIGERAILRRVLRIQSLVDSIRSVVGYNQKTLIDQNAEILRMENIYLPRIESLVGQYIKISEHDSGYDSRGLMEQLDTLTNGIQRIQADCLCRDKMNIDAEASALISAMEMDGYGDDKNPRPDRAKDADKADKSV